MKKQASPLLPALLDLLRQYLALDMAVYAGHATLLLLTAALPLLMWVLVIINMPPFYSVSDIAALVAQLFRLFASFCRISRPSSQWRWM